MSRFEITIVAALLLGGCLDDELDTNPHFLREQTSTRDEDTPTQVANGDAGSGMKPGKTINLGNLSSFIALDRDFEAFQSWTSFDLGTGAHAVVDQRAPTRVFINALPQPGDAEFRVGTLIVKVSELSETVGTWQVHAMVKRGAAYNPQGAYGWEYFDFTLDDEGVPHQNWRGANVPNGESYQTTVFTSDGTAIQQDVPDCNTCHQSSHNDAVNTEALNLDSWQ